MKLKRKLYPNSNDKEVVSMSINDLITFGQCTYALMQGAPENLLVSDIVNDLVSEMLNSLGLKKPASHQKTTKKSKQQKTEENFDKELDSTGLNEGDSPF